MIRKTDRDDNFNKASDDLTSYQVVRAGDLVVNKMKAWQGSVAVSRYSGMVSPAYFVYESLGTNHPQFMHYLLRSAPYVAAYAAASKGIRPGQWDLDPDVLRTFPIPVLSPAEQVLIADFLDRETAEIDAFIADQEELIALLTERRAATITHAVTKGLDPSASMKDSGVRWWGPIPSAWAVRRIKEIVSTPITDGPHETPEIHRDGDVVFVSAEAIGAGSLNLQRARGFISFEDDARFARKYRPRRDDIFMVKSGATTGTVAIVDTDVPFNIWSPLAAIRCGALASPRFVMYCMKATSFRESVELHWSFGTQQNIGMGVIGNLTIPLPSLDEQVHIAGWLDHEIAELDATIADASEAIALSKERRAALISAAVTGKIDVGGEA
ncbi:restriction endonuclease subunit S [uncultured Microbacterium sp.]|uniref:restriction endonuclease subunit S n=1 Tax=uncultured Microbacterium sp. TaxID=191216 RepID=UPI0028EF88FF|nr:restriction endonuclease subunit S [uncultured Microbacterium sp.]